MIKTRTKKVSKKSTLTIVVCLFLGVVLGVCSTLITQDIVKSLSQQSELTAAEIFRRSKIAMQDYPYARMHMNIVEMVDEETSESQLVVSCERDAITKNIEIADITNNAAESFLWQRNVDEGIIEVFSYMSDEDVWVRATSAYEPLNIEVYNMFKSVDTYALLDEVPDIEGYENCYVLQTIGGSSEWEEITEHIFIDKTTFLPKATITTGTNTTGTDTIVNGTTEQEIILYDETVTRYTYEFSDESLHFYEVPEEYLTAEEWQAYLTASGEGDEGSEE